MKNYLNILRTIRQKIPSDQQNLVLITPIPEKTTFFGHFSLKMPLICGNTINQLSFN